MLYWFIEKSFVSFRRSTFKGELNNLDNLDGQICYVDLSYETLKLVKEGLDLFLGGSEFHKRMVLWKKEYLRVSTEEEGRTWESCLLLLGLKFSLGMQMMLFLAL